MKKRIIVVTSTLGYGGITSFLIPLVNLLCELEYDVTLAYTNDTGNYLSRVSQKVSLLRFKTSSKFCFIWHILKNFAFYDAYRIVSRKRNQLPHNPSIQRIGYISAANTHITNEKYDIAISTCEGFCNALVALKVKADKKIAWVHPDMGKIGMDVVKGQKILDHFSHVVAVSKEGTDSLRKYFPKDADKFVYIENLVDIDSIISRSKEEIADMPTDLDHRTIVTVCRIANESKRLDRVVRIAQRLKESKFRFKWYIIGDGPDYDAILAMIRNENLEENLVMMGGRTNPLPYIAKADLFVLTSQYEGKPIVIDEAKTLHIPIIVTNYSSAKEQVTKDLGCVVPNQDGVLEKQIAELIMDNSVVNGIRMSNASYRFDNSKAIEQIKNILKV